MNKNEFARRRKQLMRMNYASMLYLAGDYAQALEIVSEAEQQLGTLLPDSHPDVLVARLSPAGALLWQDVHDVSGSIDTATAITRPVTRMCG